MLSTVVNSLNPKYYLKVCQDIWFEIGETCMIMSDIKITQVLKNHFKTRINKYLVKFCNIKMCIFQAKEAGESLSNMNKIHSASKIKQLKMQGIKYLEEFVQTFKLKR